MHYEDLSHPPRTSQMRHSTDDTLDCLMPVQRSRRNAERMIETALLPTNNQQEIDSEPLALWVMKITQSALRHAMDYLVAREPESAGLLLGPADDDLLITHFVPDLTGRGTPASFELGTAELNDMLKRMKPAGINCKGIVHSHPAGITSPSHGDLAYLRRVFRLPTNAEAGQFYMPILCGGRLYSYVYTQGRVWHADLVLI